MRIVTLFALAALSIVSGAGRGLAQRVPAPVPSGQVAATGQVHLLRPPTHLRMYMQVSGRGKTLEEALAALKERREAVAAKLDKLAAEKSSIEFSSPSVDEAAATQQRRMEMMLAQRLRAAGGAAKKGAKPAKPPVSMVSQLSVQWRLKADNPEKLLLAADELREKVKAADLAGANEAPKLSPEEQEVAEEMAAEQSRQGNEEAAAPNEPRFVFVARLTASERQKALAEAFAKARAQAAELAKAAGMELGSLASLSGEGGGNAGGVSQYVRTPWGGYSRNEEYDMVQQTIAANGGGEEHRNESLAPKPDGVSFNFGVQATFALR